MSRSELKRTIDVCETIRTDSVQYRTTGTVLPFPEDRVPPSVSLSLARFKLSWEVSLLRL